MAPHQQQQQLVRQILSWTLFRSNRLTTFHHQYRVVRQGSQWLHQGHTQSHFSTSAPMSISATGSTGSIQAKPNTQRYADRKDGSTKQRHKWTKEIDDDIIRLHNDGVSWKKIDEKLGMPHSSCHHRYYSALDPNLEVWNLNDSPPNSEMSERLVYLFEVEKQSFKQIQDRMLMNKPWETPTKFAPQEVLDSAAKTEFPKDPFEPISLLKSTGTDENAPPIRFNKVTLRNKYYEYKSRLGRNAVRANEELFHKAIRRGVELYGDNWKRVATSVDELMGQWMPSKEWKWKSVTPAKVASVYRTLVKLDVEWTMEDETVMARKILQLSKEHPDILDILSRPFREKVSNPERDRKQEQQRQLWTEISIAVGSHSPGHCKRRWNGLWSLKENEKSAQSKAWHRIERYQFWMLWNHFSQHYLLEDIASNAPLTTVAELDAAYNQLSFSKEIAKWMRYRNEAQCLKFFRSIIGSNLQHSTIQKEEAGQQVQAENDEAVLIQKVKTKASIVASTRSQVAEPLLLQLSTISREDVHSPSTSDQQFAVRSDWTRERIQALVKIVIEKKEGVKRADFVLNWTRIAEELEFMFQNTATLGKKKRRDVVFTPKQCQDCWAYVSSLDSSTPSVLTLAKTTAESEGDTKNEATGGDHQSFPHVQGWSDLELLLLQQGVRRHGTMWADVRAQFLPNKDISDIFHAWSLISIPGSVDGGRDGNNTQMAADRLSEPDYVSLMSAFDKVLGKAAGEDPKGGDRGQ